MIVAFGDDMTTGDYITIAIFIVGLVINAVVYMLAVSTKMNLFAAKQNDMELDLKQMAAETQNEVSKLTQVVILQSRHDERITALTQTVVNQGKRLDDTTRRMNTFLDLKLVNVIEENSGED